MIQTVKVMLLALILPAIALAAIVGMERFKKIPDREDDDGIAPPKLMAESKQQKRQAVIQMQDRDAMAKKSRRTG